MLYAILIWLVGFIICYIISFIERKRPFTLKRRLNDLKWCLLSWIFLLVFAIIVACDWYEKSKDKEVWW